MAVDSLSAANAYRNQLKLLQNGEASSGDEASGASSSSFAQMVEGALQDTSGALHKSEAAQMDSLTTGKVELSDLVTAISNAELSLNTVVAIRDRVINAYNDIIKMSI